MTYRTYASIPVQVTSPGWQPSVAFVTDATHSRQQPQCTYHQLPTWLVDDLEVEHQAD